MIAARRLLPWMFAEPFRAFRIRTTDGGSVDVRHPDMMMLGRFSLKLSRFFSDPDEDPEQGDWEIPLAAIESVEAIDLSERDD
jgi:hypothetical protein